MITLDATTASIEVILAGAITTTQLPIVCSYADKTSTTFTPGKTTTATNSTSTVTIVAAPAASTQREVHSINVYNADTASATITIRENDNSTLRILAKVILAVADTLTYSHAEGWKVTDTNGNTKIGATQTLTGDVTGSGSGSIATTVAKIQSVTVSGTTGTGNVVFSATPTFTGTLNAAAIAATGLLDISASGAGQISFPATQNPSAGANVLDDYEEGTWTPSDGSGAGLSFTSVAGRYTKIGNIVHATGTFTYPSTASGADAILAGFPFACDSSEGSRAGNLTFTQSTTANKFIITASATSGVFRSTAGANVTNVQMSGTVNYVQASYRS